MGTPSFRCVNSSGLYLACLVLFEQTVVTGFNTVALKIICRAGFF
ncbi:hypothetical protein TFKS16_1558 [Tannerella forsythia KS16]|uniref:Uncharacterized protein n=1 Tax=Tannerella forsythia (strain ATCC 43037 / JCM 10827 / CCUG 21028 A / KCTC 5666 / FDC 338) TaxID=203275 RepID=G8UN72_TANFA|nr:hypothetical protein BFO_1758 [Tannerella forsythia 92A2]BAR49117.1 hypothetical protein TF3313_1610 [Tannerella forsythia 3313]BAR51803.1 hypothetical protein TFKS16_1558 [Tannerella forsythia KS16]